MEIHDESEERDSELSGGTTTTNAIPDDVDQKPHTALCVFNSFEKPIIQKDNEMFFDQTLETPPTRYFKYRSIVRVREEQDYLVKEKRILALNEQRQPKEKLVEAEVLTALKFTTKKDGSDNVLTNAKNTGTPPADKLNIKVYKDKAAKQSTEANKSTLESDVLKLAHSAPKSRNKKRKHDKNSDFKPYDYKNVDYGRFASKNQHDQNSRRKRKRHH